MKNVLKYVLSGVVLWFLFGTLGTALFGSIIGGLIAIVSVVVGLLLMKNIDRKKVGMRLFHLTGDEDTPPIRMRRLTCLVVAGVGISAVNLVFLVWIIVPISLPSLEFEWEGFYSEHNPATLEGGFHLFPVSVNSKN